MNLVRTILAVLIALSVALVPAAANPVVHPLVNQAAMTDQTDMPCCPSCCKTHDDAGLTLCALNCIGIAGPVISAMSIEPLFSVRAVSLPLADDALREFLKKPPTHPPSV